MIKPSLLLYLIIGSFLLTSCKEKYNPVLKPEQKNFLVVEGILSAGGITNVQLSRTTDLNEKSGVKPETNATLIVIGSDGSQAALMENTPGNYLGELPLSANNTYSLHIRTTEGKDYVSTMETVKQSPPIDTVSWNPKDDDVQLKVSTHDDSQTSQYYKWDYQETWEIHSNFPSNFVYDPITNTVYARDVREIPLLYTCWVSQPSTSVLVGSSIKLNEGVIHDLPLYVIKNGDERLSVRYSILVRQYAIDKNAYNFYQQLKSNTESLGSIFDRLPTDISGNIQSVTDPNEKVIGYVSASSATEKRLFISAAEVQNWNYRINCEVVGISNNPESFKNNFPPYYPFDAVYEGRVLVFYKSASIYCIDCRTRGSNQRPSFW